MATGVAPSLFLLNRVVPHAASWSDDPEFYTQSGAEASRVPLSGFATKQEAEAARKRLERAARESTPLGPFLRELLPAGMSQIADAAKAVNLPPPDSSSAGPPPAPVMHGAYSTADYEYGERLRGVVNAWWASAAADITPEVNAKLWDALFPDYAFYTIHRVLFEE